MNEEQRNQSAKVVIYGKEYLVHGRGDLEFIRKVAKYVDERMAEIDEEVQTTSIADLAILAALNIAHELFLIRGNSDHSVDDREIHERVIKELSEKINQLINED